MSRVLGVSRRWVSGAAASRPPPPPPVALKYDPARARTNFTSFGVLPFLQVRLNEMLTPSRNVEPTPDQKLLLAVMQSQYSAVLRGHKGSGKSLAIAVYAVNFLLTRVPNFGVLSKLLTAFNSVDTVVVAASDAMVRKYQRMVAALTREMPADCCPDRMSDDGFTRRPFKAHFRYATHTETHVTAGEDDGRSPHVVVTTASGLDTLVATFGRHLQEVRVVAVDDVDLMLNCTECDGAVNVAARGRKARYVPVLTRALRQLQQLLIEGYRAALEARLRRVERRASATASAFDHTAFVLADNTLAAADVDDAAPAAANRDLLKRLVKAKRQVLYKPIQYCFTYDAKPAVYHVLTRLHGRARTDDALRNIEGQVQQMARGGGRQGSGQLQRDYADYLGAKSESLTKRELADALVEAIEKMIRFDDSERFYRNRERKVLAAGAFVAAPVRVRFLELVRGGVADVDVLAVPSKMDAVHTVLGNIDAAGNNLGNLAKQYLRHRGARLARAGAITRAIRATVRAFRQQSPGSAPFLIVVPPYYDEGGFSDGAERFERFSDDLSKPGSANVLIHPSELVAADVAYENLAVIGMECLLPQLAMLRAPSTPLIAGILDPLSDLFYFYAACLVGERNMVVTVVAADDADRLRLATAILYNDIHNTCTVERLLEKPSSALSYVLTEEVVALNKRLALKVLQATKTAAD
jgi:hypothetical protein